MPFPIKQPAPLRRFVVLVHSVFVKALVIRRFAGPEALELQDIPEPQPGPNEVLVKLEAAGLNFADVMTASGGYPGLPGPPLVVGREFAGTRQDTGEHVMGYTQWGAFAEWLAARRELLWSIPKGWTAIEAAAFPVNYFTAYFAYWKAGLLNAHANSTPRVLIHAVAGGVGTASLEIGKLLGVEMFGTSSSDEKLSQLGRLGLHHPINYKHQDYEQVINKLTEKEGVDAVFEMLGGEHVSKSVRCLRDFGRVITYGSATGHPAQLDPRILYPRGTSIHGLWLTQLSKNSNLMSQAWQQLSEWANAGCLRPIVGHTFSLPHAGDAYRLLLEGKNFGKIVLTL